MKKRILSIFLSLLFSSLLLFSTSKAEEDKEFSHVKNLMEAIDKGNVQEVRNLLRNNKIANVHMIESDGGEIITPIFQAIQRRNVQICKVLIEEGADINFVAKFYGTPLHYAVIQGAEDIAALLLKHRAEVEKRVEVGMAGEKGFAVTPLHLAVAGGRGKMVKLLIDKGADLNIKTSKGWKCPDGCSLIEIANKISQGRELIPILKKYGAQE